MDVQQWITLLVVAVAASYLVRRGWVTVRGKADGCGECPGCATSVDSSRQPLVTLQTSGRRDP